MADALEVEIDIEETLRNIEKLDSARIKELKKVVKNSSNNIRRKMRRIVSSEATDTGQLLNSIKAKRTNPKDYRPIPKEERGLFKSVHPRNKSGGAGGNHWPFTDSGTTIRRGNRFVRIGGRWVFVRTKGSVRAVDFRERARASEAAKFQGKVERIINRNESV